MAPQLAEVLPGTNFFSPNAPQPCPTSPLGYQWFPLTTLSHEERERGTYEAAPVLDQFIDEVLAEYGLNETRLVLVGFSQGTMMALHVGLRREKQLAGIVGFSGALAAPQKLIEEMRSKPPVMLSHGDRDELIPFPAMFEATGALEAAGVTVTKNLSHGVAHGIGPDGFQLASSFLRKVLET
jgi:phospholipase/carboxylesterase